MSVCGLCLASNDGKSITPLYSSSLAPIRDSLYKETRPVTAGNEYTRRIVPLLQELKREADSHPLNEATQDEIEKSLDRLTQQVLELLQENPSSRDFLSSNDAFLLETSGTNGNDYSQVLETFCNTFLSESLSKAEGLDPLTNCMRILLKNPKNRYLQGLFTKALCLEYSYQQRIEQDELKSAPTNTEPENNSKRIDAPALIQPQLQRPKPPSERLTPTPPLEELKAYAKLLRDPSRNSKIFEGLLWDQIHDIASLIDRAKSLINQKLRDDMNRQILFDLALDLKLSASGLDEDALLDACWKAIALKMEIPLEQKTLSELIKDIDHKINSFITQKIRDEVETLAKAYENLCLLAEKGTLDLSEIGRGEQKNVYKIVFREKINVVEFMNLLGILQFENEEGLKTFAPQDEFALYVPQVTPKNREMMAANGRAFLNDYDVQNHLRSKMKEDPYLNPDFQVHLGITNGAPHLFQMNRLLKPASEFNPEDIRSAFEELNKLGRKPEKKALSDQKSLKKKRDALLTPAFYSLMQMLGEYGSIHRMEVAHLDVKPSNTIMDSRRGLSAIDYGMSRIEGIPYPFEGSVPGTQLYWPPEAIYVRENAGFLELLNSRDLWSIGAQWLLILNGDPNATLPTMLKEVLSKSAWNPQVFRFLSSLGESREILTGLFAMKLLYQEYLSPEAHQFREIVDSAMELIINQTVDKLGPPDYRTLFLKMALKNLLSILPSKRSLETILESYASRGLQVKGEVKDFPLVEATSIIASAFWKGGWNALDNDLKKGVIGKMMPLLARLASLNPDFREAISARKGLFGRNHSKIKAAFLKAWESFFQKTPYGISAEAEGIDHWIDRQINASRKGLEIRNGTEAERGILYVNDLPAGEKVKIAA